MKFKLLMVMTDDDKSGLVIETARANGATGCTVITSARGEGLKPAKTFMGLNVAGQRDVILLLVEEHLSRHILEEIGAQAAARSSCAGYRRFFPEIGRRRGELDVHLGGGHALGG